MPNIEIKAKCHNFSQAMKVIKSLNASHHESLHQVDTYFATKQGKLKLREINDKTAELIPYIKQYSKGPYQSQYCILSVSDPSGLKKILDSLLGTLIVVNKHRDVYLFENVRIHLDNVVGLGQFIEFEAVYQEDDLAYGQQPHQDIRHTQELKVKKLIKLFQINDSDLLDKSYVDYLLIHGKQSLSKNASQDCVL